MMLQHYFCYNKQQPHPADLSPSQFFSGGINSIISFKAPSSSPSHKEAYTYVVIQLVKIVSAQCSESGVKCINGNFSGLINSHLSINSGTK